MAAPQEPADDVQADRVDNVIRAFDLRGGESKGIYRIKSDLVPSATKPFPTASNALLILANDPPLAGMLGFNEFVSAQMILRPPPVAQDGNEPLPGPYPRQWTPVDESLILSYIQRTWCAKMNKASLIDAMIAEASQRRFHPVRDWLRSLIWDGKDRINAWLHRVFGVPNDSYHQAIGSKTLIAAVRRVMHPGCKFDQMLVLEGKQNLGKSTAVKDLFSEQWFSDCLHADLTHRDAPMSLTGKWGVELAEIQHFLRNGDEAIKAFLSRPIDTYRVFKGAQIIDVPRQSILIGTTNTSDYLRDVTGNRRIWPVKCVDCRSEYLRKNRDQLWAEAVIREQSGEVIFLDTDDIKMSAETAQIERMQEDTWAGTVYRFLQGTAETRVSEILNDGLQLPRAQQTRATEMRVAAILRSLEWMPTSVRKGSAVLRVWHPPEPGDKPF